MIRRSAQHIGWPTLAGFARVGFPTVFVVLLTAFLLVSTACQGGKEQRVYAVYTGGDPARGVQAIEKYRCGACHIIPGIHNANGLVGPPLLYWSRRTYVGGEVPNNPENLEKWIMSPKSIEPGTAMPTLGLSDQEAKDVAAYLYTLH